MPTIPTAPRRLATAPFASLRTWLACAVALTTLAARPADAQLRKLKDLGKAAVKGAVEGTAEGAAKKAIGGGESGAPAKPGTVQFTENLLEITDARIAQFIKGFDAEIAARPAADRKHKESGAAYEAAAKRYEAALADHDRKQAEWDKQNAAQRACAEQVNAKYEKANQKDVAASEQAANRVTGEISEDKEKKLQAMADRMKAAQARGDQVAVRAIADSVMREMQGVLGVAQQSNEIAQRMTARSKEAEAEMRAKCPSAGEPPKRPEMPKSVDPDAARQITDEAAAKASGLTPAQYALMKERIETYVRYKGRTGSTQYIFTAAELEALGKQLAELQKRPDLVEPTYWYPGKQE